MRALYVPAAGEKPQIGELPVPPVTEGTVLVRVKAAGLNAIDSSIAAGRLTEMLPHEYPVILGRDAAGIVEGVGAGVDHVRLGDDVIGHVVLAPPIQAGSLAEFVVLPATAVTHKPTELDFAAAAALPLAGAAAAAAVDIVDPTPGQTVLVNGATGGVGSYVLQLLADRDVTVIATGTPGDVDRLRRLGATSVVDYTAGNVSAQVRRLHPDGVDALVNLTGFDAADIPLAAVRRGGRVATTTGVPDDATLAAGGLTGGMVLAQPGRDVLASLVERAAAGRLKIDVDTVLPLEQAHDGLATIAAGKARGKTVIVIHD